MVLKIETRVLMHLSWQNVNNGNNVFVFVLSKMADGCVKANDDC